VLSSNRPISSTNTGKKLSYWCFSYVSVHLASTVLAVQLVKSGTLSICVLRPKYIASRPVGDFLLVLLLRMVINDIYLLTYIIAFNALTLLVRHATCK